MSDANRKEAKEITNENIEHAWKQVVQEITIQKVAFKNTVADCSLSFQQQEITIHASVVALDFLKEERIKLLDFFKKFYHNENLNVKFVAKINEIEEKGEMVMSTREIFEMMAQKNPNLRMLKDKFGMDFEY